MYLIYSMRSLALKKSFAILTVALGVFFWQTGSIANMHSLTMDSGMTTAECTTSLPCITAVHLAPLPFIVILAITAIVVLFVLMGGSWTNRDKQIDRLKAYIKNWHLQGGGSRLFDYLQLFLSRGILQLKVADVAIN